MLKKVIISLILLLLLSPIILLPLFIKGVSLGWLDTESAWIGYYGSVISSVSTVVGVWLTLEHARKVAEDDRRIESVKLKQEREDEFNKISEEHRLQHMPYIQMMVENPRYYTIKDNDYVVTLDEHGDIVLALDIVIKNVGAGTMLHIGIESDNYEIINDYPILASGECIEKGLIVRVKDGLNYYPIKFNFVDVFERHEYTQSAELQFDILNQEKMIRFVQFGNYTKLDFKKI